MNIRDLIPARNLKHVSETSGGEWQGPCPLCGGTNRFSVWPNHDSGAKGGKFHCRGCKQHGDAIAFLMLRDGLKYPDACRELKLEPRSTRAHRHQARQPRPAWQPKHLAAPCDKWQQAARLFVDACAARMLPDMPGLDYALSRGLTAHTVQALRIGYNPAKTFDSRETWGLPPEQNEKGNPKKVCLWDGLVLPCAHGDRITAVKVRYIAGTDPERQKYSGIVGSAPGLALGLETPGRTVVIVESELDAILVWQEAGDVVGALALGTASGKPDAETTTFLRAAPQLLLALDNDEAGEKALAWWKENFANVKRWAPHKSGKDVGDMTKAPGLIRAWIRAAVRQAVPWPETEPCPVDTATPAGRYACLKAIVDVYGARLMQDAAGFSLACPETMPEAAKTAALTGLEELTRYIQSRMKS